MFNFHISPKMLKSTNIIEYAIYFVGYIFTNWIALGRILDQTSQCSLVWISLVPTPKLEHPNNKSIGFEFGVHPIENICCIFGEKIIIK
jgi:hypothetical protein